jgi:hypothetical protein
MTFVVALPISQRFLTEPLDEALIAPKEAS